MRRAEQTAASLAVDEHQRALGKSIRLASRGNRSAFRSDRHSSPVDGAQRFQTPTSLGVHRR